MFYLNDLKLLVKMLNWKLALYSLFFISLLVGLNWNEQLQNKVIGNLPKIQTNPYISVILSKGIDANHLKNKLLKLNGVVSVEEIDADRLDELAKKQRELMSGFSGIIPNVKFSGVKIFLNKSLPNEKIILIKEYLERMYGADSVFIGGKKKSTDSKVNYDDIGSSVSFSVFIISLIFWALCLLVLIKDVKRFQFLLAKFQQVNKPHYISWFAINFSMVIIVLLIAFLNEKLSFNGIFGSMILMCVSCLPFLSRRKWAE